ncbi:enoyl-CoA hydratase [Pseudosulfitobacter pseudonitzschiae]|uniref:enoyl-CoA hydratase n=1 Tax=Pseudosulfitobacter pseudonitzschiae TaxID=1402135 RepID=UPI001AF5D237|nr:enoyl-CoA hydratase [Pseudosulfitobacter pseudonitzschiae]MBM1817274.1 enoyl-CoA hydratase [Pseudosulfitobacter pseudonitzschiae]MBM1834285.1 enoyl-CoA hydratase [Pseudosulfitobacter pseudonitzschiae]MBM1839150.1 enoyl-CoA hydratase [Pseudosulfitobacter pseudonitzschiae]MBM1843999.1 enoyl-CoA hydratase [Pseudosulfitobacter pseudonitzschiae]MBM1848835.1 enoyl-CoA hydratase [Pseudosulfitobacter pseudonitzschiae]
MAENITLNTVERVTTLTISRPAKRNAITQDMYAAMADALETYTRSDDSRAFVITGAEDYFTAGNDLQGFAMGPRGDEVPPVTRFLAAISTCPKPLIAAVNGPAIGVGVTMLLHCDLIIASDTATFSTPFVQLGLVPEAASSLLLPATVGMAVANDMLLANRVLDSDEAVRFGLVSRLTPFADLIAETAKVAAQLANAAPNAILKSKSLIRQGREQVAAQMEKESILFAEQLDSPEFAEVIAAKTQKRMPNFT